MKTIRPKTESCGTRKNYETKNEDEKNKNCVKRNNYKAKNEDGKTKTWALWDTKELWGKEWRREEQELSTVLHERIMKQGMKTRRTRTEPRGTRKNYKTKNENNKTKNWSLWNTKEL